MGRAPQSRRRLAIRQPEPRWRHACSAAIKCSMHRRVASALLLVPALACAPPGPTWHGEVRPIVEARCAGCHVAGGIAPFALDTYQEAKGRAAAMAAAVESNRMPPWGAGAADVGYLHDPSLTPGQKQAVRDWADRGAPEGDPARPGAPLAPVGGGLERVDLTLAMDRPYTPAESPDDYRCFPITWPLTSPTFVTGFNALPGTPGMVHHIALYIVPPDAAAYPSQWDAEDATPGYSCFGGPFGNRPQQFAVNLLTAWIPGAAGVALPRGGGIRVEPGATLVLQMHYNVAAGAQPDQSSFQFQLADTVDRRMAYQPFLDPAWVAGAMRIPPGASNVAFQYLADPRNFFSLLGSPLDNTNGFSIEAVMFHMHTLGSRGQLWLQRANGSRVRVLDIPAWDFHWQQQYFLAEPLRFEPGDQLHVKCTFDNSPGRLSTTREVNWGEGSEDEMCVANLLSSE